MAKFRTRSRYGYEGERDATFVTSFNHKHFASSTAFAAWIESHTQAQREASYYPYRSSYEREFIPDMQQGLSILKGGDTTHVETARSMVSQFTQEIEVPHTTWQHDVAGFFPDVPAFLAGEPENMWVQQAETSDSTPVRIWVGVSSSWGVDYAQLAKRGAAIAAFAIALSERRPVYITPFVIDGDSPHNYRCAISWDLQTSPMILSEVVGHLAHPSVIRHLGLHTTGLLDSKSNGHFYPGHENIDDLRRWLGAKDSDIVLKTIFLLDDLLTNPVKWIQDNLSRYLDGTEENS